MAILPHLPFRLVYKPDGEHPYGRLRWLHVKSGQFFGPLTKRILRERRAEENFWPTLLRFEQHRKRDAAAHKKAVEMFRGVRFILIKTDNTARATLHKASISVPSSRSLG
jgi:hypothetical protein